MKKRGPAIKTVRFRKASPRSRLMTGAALLAVIAGLSAFAMPNKLHGAWISLTHWAGFEVRAVYVIGRRATARDDILAAVNVKIGDPLFRVKAETVRQAVERIGRVKAARVERRLDGTILVRVEERSPHALWRQSGRYHLIDREGVPLKALPSPEPVLSSADSDLPLLVGALAARQAGALFAMLDDAPDIRAITVAAVNHHGRRWDLHLRDGPVLRLPETGLQEALQRARSFDRQYGLFKQTVRAIDLRQPGRIGIEPADTTVTDAPPDEPPPGKAELRT